MGGLGIVRPGDPESAAAVRAGGRQAARQLRLGPVEGEMLRAILRKRDAAVAAVRAGHSIPADGTDLEGDLRTLHGLRIYEETSNPAARELWVALLTGQSTPAVETVVSYLQGMLDVCGGGEQN